MKKLSQLIDCDYDINILGISTDSRNIEPGFLFVATKGFNVDHYDYIEDAIKNGAVAVIATRDGLFSIPVIVSSDIDKELVSICEKFYNVSSSDFNFIGITGTDGKTTTATITRNLLNSYMPTAYLGTNGFLCGKDVYSTTNTTPCVEELYYYFSIAKKHRCKVIVIEVSSEALLHHRVDSILFDVIGFTNITEDHLNVHKTIENYRKCKFKLASLCKKDTFVFVNGDDTNCQLLNVNCKVCYGVSQTNDCIISNVKFCKDNTSFTVSYLDEEYHIQSPFFGLYNVYNVVLALLLSSSFGISLDYLCKDVSILPQVLGRREIFHDVKGFDILLDYAHTEYGIFCLLRSLTNYSRIIVVTGAAGGREQEKRSRIGNVLFQYADFIVFTSDDPRYENPRDIYKQMLGSHVENKHVFIKDRKMAISYAFRFAQPSDVIAIIGKGRDNYMAVFDKRIPYSDYEVIMQNLKEK